MELYEPLDAPPEGKIPATLIRCGGELVTLFSLPGPVLPHADNPIWIRASAVWPEARLAGIRHGGHVVIGLVGTRTPRLRSARVLTAVAGALAATAPDCCAVAWDGRVARSAETWRTMARGAFTPYDTLGYPFMLWIDVVPFRSETTFGAVTVALSAFADREIEFETDRADLSDILTKVGGLAAYLIEHGPVVGDGNTFGGSAEERITARHVISTRFPGLPVLYGRVMSEDRAAASDNLTRLLTDRQVAPVVNAEPDADGVLPSYLNVTRGFLDQLSASPDGISAEAGNTEATRKVAGAASKLQWAMEDALPIRKLLPYWPN